MAAPSNRRPGFSRRAQYGLFFGYAGAVGGAAIGVVLLVLSTFNPPAFAVVRGLAAEVTTPVASGLSLIRRGVFDMPGGFGEYFGVLHENRRLKRELADSQALIQRARILGQENTRLRSLLQVRDRAPGAIVAARLVASSASSTRRYATLNAGTRQGVQAGQPVRGPDGLIGQVVEVGFDSARILLIVDPESIVPVRRVRDGVPAIVAGRGDGSLEVRSAGVSNLTFRPGDSFVTSGTGGVFPPNIPVALVVQSGRDSAAAQSAANPNALDFALVMPVFLPAPPEAPK